MAKVTITFEDVPASEEGKKAVRMESDYTASNPSEPMTHAGLLGLAVCHLWRTEELQQFTMQHAKELIDAAARHYEELISAKQALGDQGEVGVIAAMDAETVSKLASQ